MTSIRHSDARPACQAFTLIELLAVISIIGLLTSLLLAAVQQARESARRIHCVNNLKQLGLAAALHEDTHRIFPTGGWGYRWVGDSSRGFRKRQPGGWVYNVLPFLEQRNVYELASPASTKQVQLERTGQMIQTPINVFYCPSRRLPEVYPTQWQAFNSAPVQLVAKTDYAANAGDVFLDVGSGPVTLEQGDSNAYFWPNYPATGICYLRSEVTTSQITDGTSNTLLIGEKNLPRAEQQSGTNRGDDQSMYSGDDFDTLRWTSAVWLPANDKDINDAHMRFGAAHASGCNFVFCDGSVRMIAYTIDGRTYQNLGDREDSQAVDTSGL